MNGAATARLADLRDIHAYYNDISLSMRVHITNAQGVHDTTLVKSTKIPNVVENVY